MGLKGGSVAVEKEVWVFIHVPGLLFLSVVMEVNVKKSYEGKGLVVSFFWLRESI